MTELTLRRRPATSPHWSMIARVLRCKAKACLYCSARRIFARQILRLQSWHRLSLPKSKDKQDLWVCQLGLSWGSGKLKDFLEFWGLKSTTSLGSLIMLQARRDIEHTVGSGKHKYRICCLDLGILGMIAWIEIVSCRNRPLTNGLTWSRNRSRNRSHKGPEWD
jgi:hypothetical protein